MGPPTPAPTPVQQQPTPQPTLAPTTTPSPPQQPTPEPTPAPTPVPPQQPTPQPTPGNWIEGTYTTGYWDCCKPSCSWPGKGNVNRPVATCDAQSHKKLPGFNDKSVCDGGSAASCKDNQPFVYSNALSMGFAAAAVSGSHGLVGD